MSSTRSCPNCGLLSPGDARICDCGYDFLLEGIPVVLKPVRREDTSSFDLFLRNHAGKMLVAAFVVPIPLSILGAGSGEAGFFAIGTIIWIACIALSIAGYQARKRD